MAPSALMPEPPCLKSDPIITQRSGLHRGLERVPVGAYFTARIDRQTIPIVTITLIILVFLFQRHIIEGLTQAKSRTKPMTKDLKVGCQTFTWEMLGNAFAGGPDDLLRLISQGGYSGIEITDTMIGGYAGKPAAFATALKDHGLTLVSFAIGSKSGFTVKEEIGADLEATRRWIDFATEFPGAIVSIGSATVVSEGAHDDKFAIAAEFYNRAGDLGKTSGVDIAVHPSSHHNTLLFDRADYDRIFALLDEDLVGWVPDTGHILRGHADILDTLRTYQDRIRYLHLKDVDADGKWAMLGTGVCDTPAIIDIVAAAPKFNGWLVLEEESDTAAADPAAAVKVNRQTMRSYGA
jgi:inosose dehydratase